MLSVSDEFFKRSHFSANPSYYGSEKFSAPQFIPLMRYNTSSRSDELSKHQTRLFDSFFPGRVVYFILPKLFYIICGNVLTSSLL